MVQSLTLVPFYTKAPTGNLSEKNCMYGIGSTTSARSGSRVSHGQNSTHFLQEVGLDQDLLATTAPRCALCAAQK